MQAKSKGSAAAILAEKKAMRESSRSQEDKSPQQHYPSPGDSNLSSWYSSNLESTSFMEDSQEFDAIASEYLDIGYYTLKDKYYDPYPFSLIQKKKRNSQFNIKSYP